MSSDKLFEAALQLAATPWRVVHSDFSGQPAVLETFWTLPVVVSFLARSVDSSAAYTTPPRNVGGT